MTVLADVNYVEPWWMQILKSLVIFLVGLQLRAGRAAWPSASCSAASRAATGPTASARSARCSRSPTSSSCSARRTSDPALGRRSCTASRRSSRSSPPSARRDHPVRPTRTSSAPRPASTAWTCRSAPLYVFALGAVAFYGLMLGGWASGSKYSFLGSMRAAAQLISYEVAQGLALVGVIMTAQHAVARRHRRGARRACGTSSRSSSASSSSWSRASPRPTARRSTSPRPTPSWSAAT